MKNKIKVNVVSAEQLSNAFATISNSNRLLKKDEIK